MKYGVYTQPVPEPAMCNIDTGKGSREAIKAKREWYAKRAMANELGAILLQQKLALLAPKL